MCSQHCSILRFDTRQLKHASPAMVGEDARQRVFFLDAVTTRWNSPNLEAILVNGRGLP